MLNSKKQIYCGKQNQKSKNFFFYNLPNLPSNSFLQSNIPRNILNDLNVVSTVTKPELSSKNFRFSPPLKDFRSYCLVRKYKRQRIRRKNKLKSYIVSVDHLFRKLKRNFFLFAKRNKGGFMVTSAGSISFMPKSLGKLSPKGVNEQYLIKFIFFKKYRRFSSKCKLKLNLVSSSKLVRSKKKEKKKK